jgi:excisionase family DNA binding protein
MGVTMSESVLVSIRGAAALAGVSHWSVRTWIWNGELPYIVVGRSHMVTRQDVLRWIETHKTVAGSGPSAGTRKTKRASLDVSKN